MKRDMNIVRDLLLKIEADEEPNYHEDTILYHINLLYEAHLIEGTQTRGGWDGLRLTWEGHDFLDAAREDKVWRKALDKLGSAAASVSFTVLKTLLESIVKSQLGL